MSDEIIGYDSICCWLSILLNAVYQSLSLMVTACQQYVINHHMLVLQSVKQARSEGEFEGIPLIAN